jgi:nucleoside-diphosphate-sugar epimerase
VGRLRDGLGWAPAHDLAAGLEQTVDWWRGELIRTGELAT